MAVFEALEAAHGDCLLLRWKHNGKDRLAVIDGSPGSKTYLKLRKRLAELAKGQQLRVDLMMVSHIDDDHIVGLLNLMKEERKLFDQQRPTAFDIRCFWHNSFAELADMSNGPADLAALASDEAQAEAWAAQLKAPEARAVLASVNKGRALRDLIRGAGLEGNPPFDGLVVGRKDPVSLQGLTIHVVGPLQPEVEKLRKEWHDTPPPKRQALQAYLDDSASNLSSIVCIVEVDGARVLLTGDARGDHMLKGLKEFGHLNSAGKAHFDVVKVPHHGSDRNMSQDFFDALSADHYVISADGKHHNPSPPVFDWIVNSRGKSDEYTIHVTNELPWMAPQIATLSEGRKFKFSARPSADLGLSIDL